MMPVPDAQEVLRFLDGYAELALDDEGDRRELAIALADWMEGRWTEYQARIERLRKRSPHAE